MAELRITKIVEEDLEQLADLYQQLLPNDVSIEKMRQVLRRNEQNKNHLLLAAKIDGKIVGTLLAVLCEMVFGQCRSFMVIEDVVVDSKVRRRGIGAKLMRYAETYGRQNNCSYVMLITDRERKGPQQFYASLGYKTEMYAAFKKYL